MRKRAWQAAVVGASLTAGHFVGSSAWRYVRMESGDRAFAAATLATITLVFYLPWATLLAWKFINHHK